MHTTRLINQTLPVTFNPYNAEIFLHEPLRPKAGLPPGGGPDPPTQHHRGGYPPLLAKKI